MWHKLYSIPFTKVFGKVACRVCSKPLGCGQAERNWGALKHLKTGKRSHLSAEKAERQATVYGAASIEKSRAVAAEEERNGWLVESRWTDADILMQVGLECFDGMPGEDVPAPVVARRLFKAWIEDWEWEAIGTRDVVMEARLLQKYGGLSWIDPDENELCVAIEERMEFQGGRNGAGWCLLGTRVNGDGGMEPWVLDVVIDLIAEYEQPSEMNIEVIVDEELRVANGERILEEKAQKRADATAKKRARKS